MDDERLIAMANQIARNLAVQGEAAAAAGTFQHIRDFWDPRMRTAILAADRRGLDPIAAQAIAQLFHPMLYPRTSPVLELSQEEIGLLTGLSRQRVNQAMRHLAALELVQISYQSIRVINLDGLRAFGMASL